ncbi:hypothetical protein Poli38472_002967 [Pythium oligandrum]|uniref:Methyltransferase domain-containing protein n=1 Tax=Pythium oligandrum TaxID=41045 RepID=A0A8K1C6Q1_PYTOL|nr:hypothetical protein Poli38472_002967 [Pythium oligandrum]|eukprot:TMW57042.1 hypothetical protein Poli38472_002967 [Pythium oligandrum]
MAAMASPPPLFEQTNVRKPEYWQFAKLIAPSTSLPEGKKHWTADDAVGIWCLKCQKALIYQKGSSQSIRYHMETKHRVELDAFREQNKDASQGASKKRKTSADTLSVIYPGGIAVAPSIEENCVLDLDEPAPSLPQTTDAIVPVMEQEVLPTEWNWAKNLERRGGFWGNAQWYDLQLERRMPLVKPMLEEMVLALPPCDGKHVLDLCAGSGRASEALVRAYPTAFVTLVDGSEERLHMAQQRLHSRGYRLADEQLIPAFVDPLTLPTVSPVPVDVVIGSLAFHVLVAKPSHYTASTDGTQATPVSKEELYEQLFRGVYELLKPGGHLVFGDHVGQMSLFTQLQVLARVGFVDVDCAWRQSDFFVAGARKPSVL